MLALESRWARRLMRATVASAIAMVALSVLVHVPAVQARLGWRGGAGGGCPFGHDAKAATAPRAPRATDGPALGFALGTTTRADLDRWAAAAGVRCRAERGGTTLACSAVPARALDAGGLDATTVWFDLPDRAHLAAIRAVRRADRAAPVAAAFTATRAHLARAAGPATRSAGAVARLERGAFEQAEVEHRRPGYRAVVNATNLGDGFVLTERYQAY